MKKWIRFVLFRHWITGILILTLTASYSWYVFFQIKWEAATHQTDEYVALYTSDCPAILLTNDGITFDPPTDKIVSNADQLMLVFGPSGTTETLPDNAAKGSLLFLPGSLTYRGREKDHDIQLGDGSVKVDSLYISSEKLNEYVSEKKSVFGTMIFFFGWLLMVMAALLLGLIIAAIFMGLDLLTRERLSWSTGYNISSIILFFLWLLWYLQNMFNWHIPVQTPVFLVLYILLGGTGLTFIHSF